LADPHTGRLACSGGQRCERGAWAEASRAHAAPQALIADRPGVRHGGDCRDTRLFRGPTAVFTQPLHAYTLKRSAGSRQTHPYICTDWAPRRESQGADPGRHRGSRGREIDREAACPSARGVVVGSPGPRRFPVRARGEPRRMGGPPPPARSPGNRMDPSRRPYSVPCSLLEGHGPSRPARRPGVGHDQGGYAVIARRRGAGSGGGGMVLGAWVEVLGA